MYGPLIAYGVICLFWAYVNAQTIRHGGGIAHWANMILHASACLYFGVFVHWLIGLTMFFEARPLFDTALNLFRGLAVGYVPPKPASIIDQTEKKVFEALFYFIRKKFNKGSYPFLVGILPKVIYATLFVVLLLLYSRQ